MSVANPNRFPIEQDSYTVHIPLRELKTGISDEEILARFSKGFFGGWILTPERWFFHVTGWRITRFAGMTVLLLSV